MPLPELYILRHGETVANAERRMQGGMDSPLNARGREQAEAMAQMLIAQGVTAEAFDLVSSPQGRAMQTAEPIARATGCTLRTDPRITEIGMGLWAGRLLSEIAVHWPAPNPQETTLEFYARAPEGEGFESLWSRTESFLAGLTRPTIVVTHGFTSRFLRTQIAGYGQDQLDRVPDGQGVIFHFKDGLHSVVKR